MMRDHLYRRLAAGMAAAGLLIQAAPPGVGGTHRGGRRHGGGGEFRRTGGDPGVAATCTWSAMAAAAQRYCWTDTGSETSL
jgi:hypothetical protein